MKRQKCKDCEHQMLSKYISGVWLHCAVCCKGNWDCDPDNIDRECHLQEPYCFAPAMMDEINSLEAENTKSYKRIIELEDYIRGHEEEPDTENNIF